MQAEDTEREAHLMQVRIMRRLGPSGRLALGLRMSDEVMAIQRDAIQARHPEYSEEQVTCAHLRLRLGDALFREVWPDKPLLEP